MNNELLGALMFVTIKAHLEGEFNESSMRIDLVRYMRVIFTEFLLSFPNQTPGGVIADLDPKNPFHVAAIRVVALMLEDMEGVPDGAIGELKRRVGI